MKTKIIEELEELDYFHFFNSREFSKNKWIINFIDLYKNESDFLLIKSALQFFTKEELQMYIIHKLTKK